MANLITLGRLILLYLLVHLALQDDARLMLFNAPLLLIIIALDGVDGWVARRRGEESRFGSVFDILADRVVENVLWIVLAYLSLVPIWVAIVFITRGVIVDGVRYQSVSEGRSVFGMRSWFGRVVVAGRFMRGFYGVVKATAFGWLFLIQPWPQLFPELWQKWSYACLALGKGFVFLAVFVCILRGVPVILEWLTAEGIVRRDHAILSKASIAGLGQPRWRLWPERNL
jgi:CDP-diacylglycerol---glycerol-3-phosphate 3-phosphatidyltransferase